MSTIKVDKITGRTGAAGTAPITLSGDVLTITNPILPPGATPGSPAKGQMYYDSTDDVVKVYDGSVWKFIRLSVDKLADNITATGGTVVTSGGYKYHTFTSDGNFIVSAGTGNIELLLVAGGGSGGVDGGGGGGAGGLIGPQLIGVSAQTYAIVIGAGATGCSSYNVQPASGENSTAFGLTAQGGGGAQGVNNSPWAVYATCTTGGSGGGSMWANNATNQPAVGGRGTSGQGHHGGNVVGSSNMSWEGAGGGGAGERGGDINQNRGGEGGAGRPFHDWALATSTGENGYYAGGGGGANESSQYPGVGGIGGGGQGGCASSSAPGGAHADGYNGDANTGGGGGGGDTLQAGNGGSGIAIIRYAI